MQRMPTLKQAIEAHGGITAAAALLDVSLQRLGHWVNRGVPLDQCARVEAALGVPRQALRPDDWQAIWPELATPTEPIKEGA